MSTPIECARCGAVIGKAHPATHLEPPEDEWFNDSATWDEDGTTFCDEDCKAWYHQDGEECDD
jgi:hypothetical protein